MYATENSHASAKIAQNLKKILHPIVAIQKRRRLQLDIQSFFFSFFSMLPTALLARPCVRLSARSSHGG